ncbi:Proton-coupled folate transporter [Nymphon striatum]|nr:Proton-coupled folate transporter [Nymphon striatum]
MNKKDSSVKLLKRTSSDLNELNDDDNETGPVDVKLGYLSKAKFVVSNITVEPLVFILMLSECMLDPSIQNLYLDKACVVLGYNITVCENMDKFPLANIEIEEVASRYILYANLVRKVPGVILAFFVGNWSDTNGRKLVILIPFFGSYLTNILYMLSTYHREWTVSTLLLAEIPHGIFGGWYIMFAGCMSYIADVSKKKNRSRRIGIMELAFNAGCPAGFAVTSLFYPTYKEEGMFAIALILQGIVFLDTIFRLKESKICLDKNKNRGFVALFKELFSCHNVLEAGKVMTKKRNGTRRLTLFLIIQCHFLLAFSNSGYYSVSYLYLKRVLGWTTAEYSTFETYSSAVSLIGLVLAVHLLMNMLKMNDILVGIIALISRLTRVTLLSLARDDNFAYMASGLTPMTDTCFCSVRTITSKCVSETEQGKVFLIASIADSITSLCAKIVILKLFEATVADSPSACLNVVITTLSLIIVIYVWMYIQENTSRSNDSPKSEDVMECVLVVNSEKHSFEDYLVYFDSVKKANNWDDEKAACFRRKRTVRPDLVETGSELDDRKELSEIDKEEEVGGVDEVEGEDEVEV